MQEKYIDGVLKKLKQKLSFKSQWSFLVSTSCNDLLSKNKLNANNVLIVLHRYSDKYQWFIDIRGSSDNASSV